jgi:hypothetical protein
VEAWRKKWGTPVKLDDAIAQVWLDEFERQFIPGHMLKRFQKTFGVPRAKFGNRFFHDDAKYRTWEVRLSELLKSEATHLEAVVIYEADERVEAYKIRGELRRSLGDIFVDDWHAACAIVRDENVTLYAFVEPKMKGSVVLVRSNPEPED